MPAKPFYFRQIDVAIDALQRLDSEWVDRRGVEEALGVSKTVAWRILRRSGARDGPGNTLICHRDDLIRSLETIRDGEECRHEARRRERMAGYLDRLAEVARARGTKVAENRQAVELVNSRFGRLPEGVELTPRRLTVDFSSPEEFLQRIGAIIYAFQNDFDAIRAYIEANNGHF